MNAVAGMDHSKWRDRIGLFGPTSPLANEQGIEALDGPHDYEKVKRQLEIAGYRGEPIVVLGVAGSSNIAPISEVGADQLRKARTNVDLQIMDLPTMNRRAASKEYLTKVAGTGLPYWMGFLILILQPISRSVGTVKVGHLVGRSVRNSRLCEIAGWRPLPWRRNDKSVCECRRSYGRMFLTFQWATGFRDRPPDEYCRCSVGIPCLLRVRRPDPSPARAVRRRIRFCSVKSSPSVPTGHIARPYTLSATMNFGWLPSGSGRRDISAPWSRTGFQDNIELPLRAQGHP